MSSMRGLACALAWIIVAGIATPPARALDDPPKERASRRMAPAARATKADNATYRPTVKIRRGNSAGSGTIIASAPGESLILTAAHVVNGEGDLLVELHRYNLGVELNQPKIGWPKAHPADIVAVDVEADVALIRLPGLAKLPFVARMADISDEPRPGEHVASYGIDLGEHLNSWETKVRGLIRLNRGGDGKARPFLVTEKAPEHGRSGGGLFRDDGRVIGVCVGRIEMAGSKPVGLFASPSSVRKLLADPEARAAIARYPSLVAAARERDGDREGAPPR